MARRDPIERFKLHGWVVTFVVSTRHASWSKASRLTLTRSDWENALDTISSALFKGCELSSASVLKQDESGGVFAVNIELTGIPIEVVVKLPREKWSYDFFGRYFRRSKARRAWDKARLARSLNLPVELPLAIFEPLPGQFFGSPTAFAVYERVPGPTLEQVDLDAILPDARRSLFRRCGRVLRRLEQRKLAHTDAKSSNWIVFTPPSGQPMPVLIDVYGIRWLNPWLGLFGLHRLLRAMKKHPQYTPADSLAICEGFAPSAQFVQEEGHADAN